MSHIRNGFANCPMGQGHGQVRTHFTSSGLPLLPTPVKGDKKAIHHSPEEAAVQRVLESVGELASPSWSLLVLAGALVTHNATCLLMFPLVTERFQRDFKLFPRNLFS